LTRLRSLTEAECYVRLYGEREPTVTIVNLEPRPQRPRQRLRGEELRRLFEDRLDARDPDGMGEEAA
jgi:hypothetical protein